MEKPAKKKIWPKFDSREPNYILVGTSLFFVIPCIVAYLVKQYAIAGFCVLIIVSSAVYHQNPTNFTYWLDQCTIILFTLLASAIAFKKSPWLLFAIVGFLAYAYLIYFGPFQPVCVRHPDKTTSSLWHGTLHVIPACGVAAILYA